jgi:hypothetical protein
MKKLMGLTLGLTLLTGTATVAFSQTDTDKKKATKKKKPARAHIRGDSQQIKGAAKKTTNTDRKAQ